MITAQQSGTHLDYKNGVEPVTAADLAADDLIRQVLLRHHPTHRLLTEETAEADWTTRGFEGSVWIDLEPLLDGVRRLLTGCQDIRRGASPALDIAWVAAGRLGGHTETLRLISPWTSAAKRWFSPRPASRLHSIACFGEIGPHNLTGADKVPTRRPDDRSGASTRLHRPARRGTAQRSRSNSGPQLAAAATTRRDRPRPLIIYSHQRVGPTIAPAGRSPSGGLKKITRG